ncbi:MAG: extracellular solute-binding protein, partial [Gemmobacter sp.]
MSDSLPEIAQVVFNDLTYLVENLRMPAIEDILPADELADHFAGFFPNGLELGRIDGRTYGLAYVFSTPILFSNADLFRAAGLDPDAPPATWDEVRGAAVAIKTATGKRGFLMQPAVFPMQGVVFSNGGRIMADDRRALAPLHPRQSDGAAKTRSTREPHALGFVSWPELPADRDDADQCRGASHLWRGQSGNDPRRGAGARRCADAAVIVAGAAAATRRVVAAPRRRRLALAPWLSLAPAVLAFVVKIYAPLGHAFWLS